MNINLNPSIRPLQQGDLDNLCGVYAIINALRLASSPTIMGKSVEQDLLSRGIRVLLEREILGSALRYGLGRKRFLRLSRTIVKKAFQLTGLKFRMTTFAGEDAAAEDFLRQELAAGRPVCLRISGAIDHYTVASGITQTRLNLFDSDRLSWVKRSSFCRAAPLVSAKYGIDPKALFSIQVENSEKQDDAFFDEPEMWEPDRLWEIE